MPMAERRTSYVCFFSFISISTYYTDAATSTAIYCDISINAFSTK